MKNVCSVSYSAYRNERSPLQNVAYHPQRGPLATWRMIEMISCTISPGADIKLNERVRLRRAFEILSLPQSRKIGCGPRTSRPCDLRD
jgi:hypothetical protein